MRTRFRNIKVNIENKDTDKILKALSLYEPEAMHPKLPVIWDRAYNSTVIDIFGNKYIDFTSTIFVTNTGHGQIANALVNQAYKLIHSYTYPTLIRLEAMRRLSLFLPTFCEKIYLASSGSEVTSWAINLMRAKNPKKQVIISLSGAFHGKTGSAGELENQEIKLPWPEQDSDIKKALEILNSKVYYKYAAKTTKMYNHCCGIMIESYKGWQAKFLPPKYVQELVAFCRKHKIVVCFDEVQSGFYRTGEKFAYEWYGVEPDLLCLGKALGGGFPVSALVGKKEFFTAKDMSSTHSATPLACASILSVLQALRKLKSKRLFHSKSLLDENCYIAGKNFSKIVVDFGYFIAEAHYHGMVGALIFRSKEIADKISQLALRRGLIVVNTGKEGIKFGPPLNINPKALQEGFDVLYSCISDVKNSEQLNEVKYDNKH